MKITPRRSRDRRARERPERAVIRRPADPAVFEGGPITLPDISMHENRAPPEPRPEGARAPGASGQPSAPPIQGFSSEPRWPCGTSAGMKMARRRSRGRRAPERPERAAIRRPADPAPFEGALRCAPARGGRAIWRHCTLPGRLFPRRGAPLHSRLRLCGAACGSARGSVGSDPAACPGAGDGPGGRRPAAAPPGCEFSS